MTIPPRDRQRDGLLQSAIALCDRLSTTAPEMPSETEKSQLSDRFLQISQQLQQYRHPIQSQVRSPQEIPRQVRCSFVESVALLPLFHQQALPGQIQGTLKSDTLLNFRLDPLPEHWPQNLAGLARQFCLSEDELSRLRRKLERVQQRCDRHRRIMQALLNELLNELPSDLDTNALFVQLFGQTPTSALTYIATDMQLIFALADENDPVLKRLTRFQFAQFENFPSFGPLEPSLVDPQLLTRLRETTGFSGDEIMRSLRQTIGLIPAAKADLFLVHDVYGHLWQMLLTDFCGDYRCLAQANRALKPGLAAYGDEAGPLALREVFVQQPGQAFQLDEARARYFFRGEMRQRLGHLLTHLLAETLADVQEFKWGWGSQAAELEHGCSVQALERAIALPSSSVLPHWPAKLDLTLQDLSFFLPQVLAPLLQLSPSPQLLPPPQPMQAQGSLLEQELLWELRDYSESARQEMQDAIAQLQVIFQSEYAATFPTCQQDLAANLLHLHTTINQLYTSPLARNAPFQDLLLVFVAVYCGEDSYSDFWAVDDAIAADFVPCWHHLAS